MKKTVPTIGTIIIIKPRRTIPSNPAPKGIDQTNHIVKAVIASDFRILQKMFFLIIFNLIRMLIYVFTCGETEQVKTPFVPLLKIINQNFIPF